MYRTRQLQSCRKINSMVNIPPPYTQRVIVIIDLLLYKILAFNLYLLRQVFMAVYFSGCDIFSLILKILLIFLLSFCWLFEMTSCYYEVVSFLSFQVSNNLYNDEILYTLCFIYYTQSIIYLFLFFIVISIIFRILNLFVFIKLRYLLQIQRIFHLSL